MRRSAFCVSLALVLATTALPASAQYSTSTVVNAQCATAKLPPAPPSNPQIFFLPQETTPVEVRVSWNPQNQPSFACPSLDVTVYEATEVDKMVADLRTQVLGAIKDGVVQAAIKSDQVKAVESSAQQAIEAEVRAGLLQELTTLRQQVQALEARIQTLEAAR